MSKAEFINRARQAAVRRDWAGVGAIGDQILKSDALDPDGLFLRGIAYKNIGNFEAAKSSLKSAVKADKSRDDAKMELAEILQRTGDHSGAIKLLPAINSDANQPPFYLAKAADIFTRAGLHAAAWARLELAYSQQPESQMIQMATALCAAKVGELDLAEGLLTQLLEKMPGHQRLHYELSKLRKATNRKHISAMEQVVSAQKSDEEKNIFALFALGKEYEDLGEWAQAFQYYHRGNQAAWEIGQRQGYSADNEINAIKSIATSFSAPNCAVGQPIENLPATPIFVVGLPRSGTTLVEKMITGHADVESIDESYFLENAVKEFAGLTIRDSLQTDHYERLATAGTQTILSSYLDQVDYRRTGRAYFIEKYPMNFQFLGLVARHLPEAKIIFMRRNPVDVCFALFKQPYFRFSFNLEHLADYFQAYQALENHWAKVLGDRVHFVDYEALVQNPEFQLRAVMAHIGLEYSDELLNYHKRKDASASASSAQIREKLYTSSIDKWRHFEKELKPLTDRLAAHGII